MIEEEIKNIEEFEEFKKAEEDLDELIINCANDNNLSNENINPMLDGLYDAREYLGSKIKIMWVLKDAYDYFDKDGNPYGGGYDYNKSMFKNPVKSLCKDKSKHQRENKTLSMVTYISYGLLHDYILWQNMDYISENQEVANSGKKIALINVSKMPGYTRITQSKLNKAYKIWKGVLLKQIDSFKPKVIIFGNTYSCFKDDLTQNKKSITISESSNPKIKMNFIELEGNQLLIDTYHPGNRFSNASKAEYANDIIKGVCDWMKTQN